MPKKKYKVEIPDIEYFRKLFNCYYACPVNTRAGNYVTSIACGDYENAYNVARLPNPFALVCGRVCAHPCETACRRGEIDKPISIRALKRFATEKHDISLGHFPGVTKKPKKNKKVAVIGAGPAGLSAAHDLAILGYDVTVFEKSSEVGGMLYLGLPKYRLPRDVIDLEVDFVKSLGVEIKTDTPVTKDFSIADLRKEGYEAFFISVGADQSRVLNIEGHELDGVLKGIDFLLNINLGYKVDLGKSVIIIGGGNVAIDVARTVVREIADVDNMSQDEMKEALLNAQSVIKTFDEVEQRSKEELRLAFDVARSAMRLSSKMGIEEFDIKMVCLEPRDDMPAHEEEVSEAVGEGIKILGSKGPRKIVGKDGKVTGLETIDVKSVFDDTGRFNPTFIEGTNQIISADTVILAIGQSSDLSFIHSDENVKITPRGTIQVNPDNLATTASGIFAGGDVAFGPRLIIDAVADGRRAALAIDDYLTGEKQTKHTAIMTNIRQHKMPDNYDAIKRQEPPVLPIDKRIGIAEVELSYREVNAVKEANRCLKCDINTIFDSSKCILCGGCIDVCPQYCLKLVNYNDIYKDEKLKKLCDKMYTPSDDNKDISVMIKDEERCIRCGLCARRCPTSCITMEQFSSKP